MMKFFNTMLGSWLKVVITAILTMAMAKGDIFAITLKECLSAGAISIMPIIINFLNPNDKRYGNKE
jgi:hypothetical protein